MFLLKKYVFKQKAKTLFLHIIYALQSVNECAETGFEHMRCVSMLNAFIFMKINLQIFINDCLYRCENIGMVIVQRLVTEYLGADTRGYGRVVPQIIVNT